MYTKTKIKTNNFKKEKPGKREEIHILMIIQTNNHMKDFHFKRETH